MVNYLIFREKVPKFSHRTIQWLALFDFKNTKKYYPTRFLDLCSNLSIILTTNRVFKQICSHQN
ncbi:hypothetical protein [Microcystis sp. M090S1]|uniref:hypothetical protein n=1 Tax=Microcystis sp. M090S1 TaxID=2771135 RepID=UPI00258A4153|nr:hypothetical protein [Microcystis sp. M090S1]